MLIGGVFIFVAVMAWDFLGDGLRDAADPRTLSCYPTLDMNLDEQHNQSPEGSMKNKEQLIPHNAFAKKPPKEEISDAEFRRRLKRIAEWRKERLAELRSGKSH